MGFSADGVYSLCNDLRLPNCIGRAYRAAVWQLPERLRHALARGRERNQAAFPLPELQSDAGLVGKPAAGELAGATGTLPELPSMDWMAVSVGGTGRRSPLGVRRVAILQRAPCTELF